MPDRDITPSQSNTVAAVAWYRPEQWQNLRQISVDRNKLEATHTEWLESATKALLHLRDLGLNICPVEIDVDELGQWCKKQKRPVNGAARAAFAAVKLPEAEESPPDPED